MKRIHFSAIFALALIVMLNACKNSEKEVSVPAANDSQKFSKNITVFDKSGQNSIVMRVSADDKSLIEQYTAANFVFTALKKGETIARPQTTGTEENGETEDNAANAQHVSFEVMQRSLAPEFSKIAITFNHPDDQSRASWKYYWHYSQANVDKSAFIERHNMWRRVFFGLKYRPNSGSSWSTIVSTWYKLSNNQSYSVDRNPCYQFRFHVKTKKQSAYTAYFE
ncbi:hypothetical protein [uncultured Microscilla sp.]|uniref:hypothetical protein n=1 Tax=uncultured Microscilla sp. TaxID=432653 RepID=UPI00261130C4|nr:hypothetical protein [uncultured Microscilla sp.]